MGKPLLVADGGTMTVGRRQATYVYGSFDVRLPEGREQADVEKRLQNGYIYRPDKPAAGRFDVSFVRADATVDLTAQTSDLETQIEAAQLRTEGDIFFERDITDSGTGRYRPGIDIKRGDIVDVLIWGRILPLPITRWEMISDDTTSVGWRWHVGGAMIEDSEALRSHNDQLLQQIAQEKRQMAKSISAVSRQAASAGTAAAKADGKAVAAQETADDALAKWRQQKDQLDKVQSDLIAKNAQWNRIQDRGLNELAAQQEAMKRYVDLSKPASVTASTWDPVWAGPVHVSYPSGNQVELYLKHSPYIAGASILGIARVNALRGYSFSFTADMTAGQTYTPQVGGFEAFNQVSVTVHPIVNFAAILSEERKKRGLQQ
ncbi:hypothetical protein [Corynebacterium diphtheriae]|uniref:hypothetical protein n=1 Tax=Corynebacterium diphtheriae TaxID=1717 RepID=UPI000929DE02|nr:hypothetical protein [Corynebacterium diphtheriae]APM36598.1 hypothetical protein BS112_09025 [Corynebacterium diphtheriae]OJH90323.1 hypothetical protein BKD76_01525 [Corynebacterium diphtheriae]OJH91497.1 hypothetical protein BKD79_01525 [Corynebacterium diphtheriae]OJI00223.1 hypothetical protein BKD73_01520 [Corynebacterium diphtheriae]OSQ01043.1 hypothetical protein B1A63_00045 [Corynebacterium diphtheriae]